MRFFPCTSCPFIPHYHPISRLCTGPSEKLTVAHLFTAFLTRKFNTGPNPQPLKSNLSHPSSPLTVVANAINRAPVYRNCRQFSHIGCTDAKRTARLGVGPYPGSHPVHTQTQPLFQDLFSSACLYCVFALKKTRHYSRPATTWKQNREPEWLTPWSRELPEKLTGR